MRKCGDGDGDGEGEREGGLGHVFVGARGG